MHLWILTALLGVAPATIEDLEVPDLTIEVGGLYDAPRVAPLPFELLPPSERRDGGVWLPMALHLAMTRWWGVYADEMPGLMQAHLDMARDAEQAAYARGLKLGAARERHRHAQAALEQPPLAPPVGLPGWLATTLYVVGGCILIGLGVAAGWGLHSALSP